jgi:hypothetical protein
MKYYIHKAGSQQGPYSIDELQKFEIDRITMVWHEGMEDWTQAQNIDELKGLFKSVPPPLSSPTPPPLKNKTNTPKTLAIATTVIIVITAIFFIIKVGIFSSEKETINDEPNNSQNQTTPTDSLKKEEYTKPDSLSLAEDALEEEWREREHFEQLYESFHGEYYSMSYGYGSGAKIEYIGNNQLKFELKTSSRKGCSGLLSGTLDITDGETIVYKGRECELFFEFKEDQLTIRETDCNLHHGMNCNFSATMRKYNKAELKLKGKYSSNIQKYLNPHTNSYKKDLIMGGIWDLAIKVDNKTPYKMDAVHVKIEYLKADKSVYQEKAVILYNIEPGERKRIGAPSSPKGVEVRCTISYVESSALYS